MRNVLIKARRKTQLHYHSMMGLRKPGILANSIPKSGTHLIKAILEGGGYRFVGHYGGPEMKKIINCQGNDKFFATAHTNLPSNAGIRNILVFRDPIDVAVSMALYIENRIDHTSHKFFSGSSLEQNVAKILQGGAGVKPLAITFRDRLEWAKKNDAKGLDFGIFVKDPRCVFDLIDDFDVDIDKAVLHMNKWNPTKRTKKHPDEKELKEGLRKLKCEELRACYDVYEELQNL